jgi:hypothetical protein
MLNVTCTYKIEGLKMTSRLSRIRKTEQDSRTPVNAYRYVNWWAFISLAALVVFPLAALGIYCAELSTNGLTAFGAAAMVSAASYLAGSLLGFLFGIPRALSSDAEVSFDRQHDRLITNTNLEQISDWLTKIIVGATLVQLGNLTRKFSELATFVSGIFGSPSAQNKTMAGAIILYSALLGFFVSYIAARSIITLILSLSPSDWIPEQQIPATKQDTNSVEESQVVRPDSTGIRLSLARRQTGPYNRKFSGWGSST